MRNDERAADVVQFWHAVEMFSPQQVPRPSAGKPNGHGWVLDLEADELAPWQPGHPFSEHPLPPGKTRRFTVYGGLYDITNVRRQLERVFGADEKPADGRSSGKTAMFALTVDADGYLIENSANLSACAWAISRLNEPGPDDPRWLHGFEPDERAFVTALNKLSPPKLNGDGSSTGAAASFGAKAGEAVTARVKSAARDAWDAGAQATGAAVNTAVAGAGALLVGPFVSGIAGEVVGTFVEKLLSPGAEDPSGSTPDQKEPRAPRLDLTAAAFHEFVEELAEALGIEGLRVAGVRVGCVVLSTKSAEKPNQQGFLNSFIADDLARIAKEVRTGWVGDALAAYLSRGSAIPLDRRIDVREDRSALALVDGVVPRRLPGGRWPTGPERSLVVSQQFAVNQILGEFRNQAGVFSVNGPPGTGKTTMLRDVLAGLVVKRARVLAELDDPLDAFTDVLQEVQLGPRYKVRVRGVRPALTGFEVVLATATNDAAENVTAEIPGAGAVAGAVDDALAADYFPELASRILDNNAWGLVAAVLGNMSKRGEFIERFWWSDDIGMKALLRRAHHNREGVDDWREAVTRFRQAEQKVSGLATARQRIADALQEVRHWRAEIPRLEKDLAATRTACERHNSTVARLDVRCREAHGAFAARPGVPEPPQAQARVLGVALDLVQGRPGVGAAARGHRRAPGSGQVRIRPPARGGDRGARRAGRGPAAVAPARAGADAGVRERIGGAGAGRGWSRPMAWERPTRRPHRRAGIPAVHPVGRRGDQRSADRPLPRGAPTSQGVPVQRGSPRTRQSRRDRGGAQRPGRSSTGSPARRLADAVPRRSDDLDDLRVVAPAVR